MGAGCMRGLSNPFLAPGADDVAQAIQPRTSLAPPQGKNNMARREDISDLKNLRKLRTILEGTYRSCMPSEKITKKTGWKNKTSNGQ